MKLALLALALLTASSATAQTRFKDSDGTVWLIPQRPDDDLLREALMLAYKMNGNSMVSYGNMIDLTAPVGTAMRAIPTVPVKPEAGAKPK
jgi:hypothetical protein